MFNVLFITLMLLDRICLIFRNFTSNEVKKNIKKAKRQTVPTEIDCDLKKKKKRILHLRMIGMSASL